jgi:hypothetical protein
MLHAVQCLQIHGCDAMIGKVESRLGHFDTELSKVNREIQSLEEDSDKLTAMLRNRLEAADVLGRWLESATVPPDLITAIRDGDVADSKNYTASLHELRMKMRNMQSFSGYGQLQSFPTLRVRTAKCILCKCQPNSAAVSRTSDRLLGVLVFCGGCVQRPIWTGFIGEGSMFLNGTTFLKTDTCA